MISVHALWLMSALDLVAETASFESAWIFGGASLWAFRRENGVNAKNVERLQQSSAQLAFITEKTIEHSE